MKARPSVSRTGRTTKFSSSRSSAASQENFPGLTPSPTSGASSGRPKKNYDLKSETRNSSNTRCSLEGSGSRSQVRLGARKFPHKCQTPYCRKPVLKSTKDKICTRCKSRNWALKSPLKYAFKNLRNRAKQRGKPFSLTFKQYKEFAEASGYSTLKGKSSKCLSIDRINPALGYTASNIRAIRLGTNSRLFHCKMPQWMKDEMAKAELESLENERRDRECA